jgi:hypothetical protein
MQKVELITEDSVDKIIEAAITPELLASRRHLTEAEIEILKSNGCNSRDSKWQNIYVTDVFDPTLIQNTQFNGTVVLGNMQSGKLRFHDLVLDVGIYNSLIESSVISDNVVIRNVSYLSNYYIGNQSILFNIQEMSCTNHSKFGNGVLTSGESEEQRIWVEVANENGGRKILPFETMLPADAALWSRYRDDEKLLANFVAMTERDFAVKSATFGYVGNSVVIKNTSLIKDVKIGDSAYIKGAFKLKNMTVCSNCEEPSQIGEGVEMVNGIMGYASKVFYQAVAVRFVIGRNCQLKYGARLLNSVLGDNSTVSCCELLNNLIYPFHEQHHNTSFLIASTICGQSNIAAGAMIGSNHNSRSPDGEIVAGRGFWPGLCSDFKHNCKFASFTLVAKGSYPHELNVIYPFSLVSNDKQNSSVNITPGYWFRYNMFAMARNNFKFVKRDKRVVKAQHIEMEYLAPDCMQEIHFALERIISLTREQLQRSGKLINTDDAKTWQEAKDFLHQNPDTQLVLDDSLAMRKYGAKIVCPVQGYREYRKVVKYFAVKMLMDYCRKKKSDLSKKLLEEIYSMPLFVSWENVGGQVIPTERIKTLLQGINEGVISSWNDVHCFYDECNENYLNDKVRYAIYLLEYLYSKPLFDFDADVYENILHDVNEISTFIYESSVKSRRKDYHDEFRKITYRNEKEMDAVVGKLEDNDFLQELKKQTDSFKNELKDFFKALI